MVIYFEFSSTYSLILGQKLVQIEMDGESATVSEAVSALLWQYPNFEEALRKKNLINEENLASMLICGQTLLSGDSILKDQAHVRVLSPICGG